MRKIVKPTLDDLFVLKIKIEFFEKTLEKSEIQTERNI